MKVTDIRVQRIKAPRGPLKAFVTVILDGELALHDFRVLQNERGAFVGMPVRRTSQGQYVEVVQPVTGEMLRLLQTSILRAWEDECARPDMK